MTSKSHTPQVHVPADATLKRTLGPFMIWGLGVGYVISGSYFGWNLGLADAGPYGMIAAATLVTIMYITFVLSYAELSCALPRAGGAFVYASRAMGPSVGFLGGLAQIIEFVFAPPAIAAAIGAYFNIFFPSIPPLWISVVAYLIFTGLNIWGVHLSATFELVITVLAVGELLLFSGITLPHFSWQKFSTDPLPNGWAGAFAAVPFAIWFYLAIEGIANIAEEAKNPQKDLPIGFGSAMATLVVLAFLTFFASVGVDGWRSVVYPPGSTTPNDSPLPMALSHIVGEGHVFFHLLVMVGLFGLIASFNGILLAAGRATMEFGRVGYAPHFLGKTLKKRKTPAAALIANMAVGFLALLTGRTGEIITISVFGALTLYIISTMALFRLRKKEPKLVRPYQTPAYPWFPAISLTLSTVAWISLAYYHFQLALIYCGILGAGYAWFYWRVPASAKKAHTFK